MNKMNFMRCFFVLNSNYQQLYSNFSTYTVWDADASGRVGVPPAACR